MVFLIDDDDDDTDTEEATAISKAINKGIIIYE